MYTMLLVAAWLHGLETDMGYSQLEKESVVPPGESRCYVYPKTIGDDLEGQPVITNDEYFWVDRTPLCLRSQVVTKRTFRDTTGDVYQIDKIKSPNK
jgi:hypothetical protein